MFRLFLWSEESLLLCGYFSLIFLAQVILRVAIGHQPSESPRFDPQSKVQALKPTESEFMEADPKHSDFFKSPTRWILRLMITDLQVRSWEVHWFIKCVDKQEIRNAVQGHCQNKLAIMTLGIICASYESKCKTIRSVTHILKLTLDIFR